MKKEVVFFVYDHFYPDFTAGGPVTALGNLARLLKKNLNVRILTSCYQYGTHLAIDTIQADTWELWEDMPVWYASGRAGIKKSLESLPDDVVITLYLNGIFSIDYFIYLLWLSVRLKIKVIISPRGMLQSGAMKGGRVKKEAYLWGLKRTGLLNYAGWHATDDQESKDIRYRINSSLHPVVIPDIPAYTTSQNFLPLSKKAGELRLVYFSLITEKKNLLYILQVLNQQELSDVQLDIIGPVKDKEYWSKCEQYLKGILNPERIIYKGEINPVQIFDTLPRYHALVLPTHGENFGHVIIEMLSCARPVLISDKTPWDDLADHQAGYSVPLLPEQWKSVLIEMVSWNDVTFAEVCSNSFAYYKRRFNFEELRSGYLKMFNV